MSNEITKAQPMFLQSPRELPDLAKIFRPFAGKGVSEEEVGMKILMGHGLGMDLMSSISQIHIIEGRPSISAGQQLVLCHRAGVRSKWLYSGMDYAELELAAPGRDPFTLKYTLEQAKQAGLAGKSTWQKYPAEMLRARATTAAIRAYCPEVLGGVVYDADEIEQLPRPQQPARGDIIDAEPEKPAAKKGKAEAKAEPKTGTVQQLLLVVEQVIERHGIELPCGPQDCIVNARDAAEALAAKARAEARVNTIDELSPTTIGGLIEKIQKIDADGLKSRLGVAS